MRPPSLAQGSSQVEIRFRLRPDDGPPRVVAGRLDVPELGELLQGGLSRRGVLLAFGRTGPAVLSRHGLPGGDPGRRRESAVKSGDEHLPLHVLARGEAEQREDRRRDVEQRGAVHGDIRSNPGAVRDEDSLRAVPPRRVHRSAGTTCAALEAVIGYDQDMRAGTSQRDEPAEHLVVKSIQVVHDVAIPRKLPLRDFRQARRVEAHELVADLVDALIIDGTEVPVSGFEQLRGDGVGADDLGEPRRQECQSVADGRVRRVQLRRARDQRLEHRPIDLGGMNAQFGQRGRGVRRMHRVLRRRPEVRTRTGGGTGELPGNDGPAHRLRGMAGLPAANHGTPAGLREDVPEGLAGPRAGADRPDAGTVGRGFDEAVDTVCVGPLPGGDARPQDGREHRRERLEVAHGAALHESPEVRHPAGVEQRVDHLPVGRVPADEQDTPARRSVRRQWRRGTGHAFGRGGEVRSRKNPR